MGEFIAMPKLDMSMEKGSIVKWLINVGDFLRLGDTFVEVETGKVSIEVDSTATNGTVLSLYYSEGDTVEVGSPILFIGEKGESAPTKDEAMLRKQIEPELRKELSEEIKYDYDIIVIGASLAGYTCAMQAKESGMSVALFSKPDDRLYSQGKFRDDIFHDFLCETASLNNRGWLQAIKRPALAKRGEAVASGMAVSLLSSGIAYFEKKPSIVTKHSIAYDGGIKTAKTIVIAVSANTEKIKIDNDGSALFCAGEEIFNLAIAPTKAVVVSNGAESIEIASLLTDAGSKVMIVSEGSCLLDGLDNEAEEYLCDQLNSKGISVMLSEKPVKIEGGFVKMASGHREPCDLFYGLSKKVCSGVESQIEIERDSFGFYATNEFMETKVPGIYAIGGSNGNKLSSEASVVQAKSLAINLKFGAMPIETNNVSECIYSYPQAAWIGITESKALSEGLPIIVGRAYNSDSESSGQNKCGFVKVIADNRFEEILGMHIIGPGAVEAISIASAAIASELCASDIASLHPLRHTLSETLSRACSEASKGFQRGGISSSKFPSGSL